MRDKLELTIKGDVEVLRLEPGDTIIVTLTDLGRRVSENDVARIRENVREVFPDHNVVVCAPGLTLTRKAL